MLTAIYLFAGFLVGFALAGVLFALAARHGEEAPDGCEHVWEPWGDEDAIRVFGHGHDTLPIAIVYRQSRKCLVCNEMDVKKRRVGG